MCRAHPRVPIIGEEVTIHASRGGPRQRRRRGWGTRGTGGYLEVVNSPRMALGRVAASGVPMLEQEEADLMKARRYSRMDRAVARGPLAAKSRGGSQTYSARGILYPNEQIRCSPA